MTAGVRERARLALRTEIAETMSDLFAERGFDAVTVEEAASEAGISRATFFRYFGSKEDAVLATIEGPSIDFGAALAALPAVEGESAWQLLHRTFATTLAVIDEGPERDRARVRMIHTTPSLRARLADRRLAHEDALTTALARRVRPASAAGPIVLAALAVLDLAWRRWATGATPSLRTALRECFAGLDAAAAATLAPA